MEQGCDGAAQPLTYPTWGRALHVPYPLYMEWAPLDARSVGDCLQWHILAGSWEAYDQLMARSRYQHMAYWEKLEARCRRKEADDRRSGA